MAVTKEEVAVRASPMLMIFIGCGSFNRLTSEVGARPWPLPSSAADGGRSAHVRHLEVDQGEGLGAGWTSFCYHKTL